MRIDICLNGATAPSGIQYVGITAGDAAAWLPRSMFSAGDKVFLPALAARNIHLIDKKEIEAIKSQLAHLVDYPPGLVAEAPGWNGDAFTLHDGSTFAADPKAYAPIAFEVTLGKNSQAGKPDE